MGTEGPFWRAIAVFRFASLGYAAVLLLRTGGYSSPVTAWAIFAVMAGWTAAATLVLYPAVQRSGRSRAERRRLLLPADLLVTAGCLLATTYAQSEEQVLLGAMPITATWVAAPVLAWGVAWGRRAGAVAALLMSAADLWLRSRRGVEPTSIPVNGAVLMLMAGVVVGHVAQLARQAGERMQRAVEMEAAGRERERLARGIHDSVLQVLALVQRRGAEIGGEAAELGRLAGEQEAALRALVQAPPPHAPRVASGRLRGVRRGNRNGGDGMSGDGTSGDGIGGDEGAAHVTGAAPGLTDLRELLRPYGTARVTVAAPATPLLLPAGTAREVAAAVGAALDNVSMHCPGSARAWILAEEDGGAVVVTVRDDGPGIPEGRLEEAEAGGRMGVARSIKGRMADLGGTVVITSSGTGTEVELTIPLPGAARARGSRDAGKAREAGDGRDTGEGRDAGERRGRRRRG
ncbi:MacS family sensor histidine kinase [Microbispora sp. NPDC049125]|uniref:MacS family sensor histidine kinase n=1 Tax=Microbispora sp. NPDC049125 TaxID=3154929 RepID=UPI003464F0E3